MFLTFHCKSLILKPSSFEMKTSDIYTARDSKVHVFFIVQLKNPSGLQRVSPAELLIAVIAGLA